MDVNELTGTDLNKAVAECLGIVHTRYNGQVVDEYGNPLMYDDDWSLAGEIIEREKIATNYSMKRECWFAENFIETQTEIGATPLIAAMRCFVASKQGEQDANETV